MNKILTKWIEPYVLLETLKKDCKLIKAYKFDAFSKNSVKKEFIKETLKENYFGLYMKNVNFFYLFNGQIYIEKCFELNLKDFQIIEESNKVIEMVDLGTAEAGFFNI